MYKDFPPVMCGFEQIVVIEGGENAEAVMELARGCGATSTNGDGQETFWVVFADRPKVLEPYTESALKASIPAEPIYS